MKQYDIEHLVLAKEGKQLMKIADLLIGDPVGEDGVVYQEVVLTVSGIFPFDLGPGYSVYDTRGGQQIIDFVCSGTLFQNVPEQFTKIEGRKYISFPNPRE